MITVLTNMNAHEQNMIRAWQKIITILAERTIAFQKIMLYNRRQTAKRIRKRQRLLRMQYMNRLIAIQNQFLLQMPRPVQKRVWREERYSDFWDVQVQFFTDEDWFETFRMSKKTFEILCSRLKDDMTPKCSTVNKPIPLEKRVAMALYKLATGSEYRVVSQMFGVARSTVCRFVRMLCEALSDKHMDALVCMPERNEQLDIIREFENISHLPLVLGTVGVTHIPINPPLDGFENYINADGWPSIILQGVVDHRFIFRKIELNARDPAIYVESHGDLPDITRTIDEKLIRGYLVGGAPYPSLDWILTKFSNPKDESQEFLNACIEEVTSIAEDAFCRLFARWRVISKKTDIEYRNMANVIGACVVLHNLIEMNGDKFNYEWIGQMKPSYKDMQPENDAQSVLPDTDGGNVLREFLSNFLKTCCN